MPSYNKVILLGNLTRDPETRSLTSGHTICNLGIAVSRSYQTREGERKEETTFVDVTAFGKQAEVIAKYMRKGKPLMLEGRLKLDQWEAQDGQKRSKLSVILESFQFVGGREESSDSGSSSSGGQSLRRESSSQSLRGGDSSLRQPAQDDFDLDEDVPF